MTHRRIISLQKASLISLLVIACLVYATAAALPVQAGGDFAPLHSDDPSAPASTVKLIFIHHSTGQNWLADDNGGLGIALMNNNYFVSDTNYGWGPYYGDGSTIGDHTDIPNWLDWFRSDGTPTYTAALYDESGQHAAYSRPETDPGGENEIILFKSCFPNSALEGSPDDPPSEDGWLTVGHAKYVYNQLLLYFRTHPEKLFVVITAPPLRDATYAANARAFNNWLVNDWLRDNSYPLQNVAVFDFYNVLTTNGGNANTNDLGSATGNHHRWYNNAIQHAADGTHNTLAYPTGDDHPSAAGGKKATAEFLPLLNIYYHRWKNSLSTYPSVGGCAMYPADNIWNTPVDDLPVAAQSADWIESIGRMTGFHMDFGSGTYDGGPIGIPYNVVDAGVPKVTVSFDYADESDAGPYPIPSSPLIEYGSDHHILVVDRSTCMLYELYGARYSGGAWHAGPGAIWDLNSNLLRPSGWTSADAAGLPILAGLVRYDEIAAGAIRHALRFTAEATRDTFIWPARHYASDDSSASLPPMGARFRLKASFDISGYPTPLQVILQAMKTYGIILADNGSNWYVSGAPDERWDNDMLHQLDDLTGDDFEAVDSSGLMVDVNSGEAQTAPRPSAFSKSGPADGATAQLTDLSLAWEASENATAYAYCIDTTNNTSCDGDWIPVGADTSVALSGLSEATTYYWQVRAGNSAGTALADGGAWWRFTTGPCYTLTISVTPEGGGTVASSPAPNCEGGRYTAGTPVTLTVAPAAGFVFSTWSGNADGTANPLHLTMDSDKAVSAVFLPCYSLATVVNPAGYGSVSNSRAPNCPGGRYISGTSLNLTAVPKSGNAFLSWGGDADGNANPLALTMDGDKYIQANFTALPSIPALINPANNALVTTYTPLLDWSSATPNLDHYELQVSRNNTFTDLAINRQSVEDSNFTPDEGLEPNHSFYWRVRAFDANGFTRGWSAVRSFRTLIVAPELTTPEDGAEPLANRPLFDWNDVEGASSYSLQIARDNQFRSLVTNTGITPSNYTPSSDLPANLTLYWRVQAKGPNGPSAWSVVRSLTSANPPSIPALAAPANNALITGYPSRLDWSTSTLPGGVSFGHYRLEVSNSSNFASPLVREVEGGITNSEYTFASGEDFTPNTIYYWRVRAYNDVEEYSSWSAVRTFRTVMLPPELTAPEDTAALPSNRPLFDWDSVSGATSYGLQIARDNQFRSLVSNTGVTPSNYTPGSNLPAHSTLYWRVQAKGPNGPSAWSTVRSFTTANPPSIPALISPGNNVLLRIYLPRMDWSSSTLPSGVNFGHYRLELSTSSGFDSPLVREVSGISNSEYTFTSGEDLAPNTIYYWRVRAYNDVDEYSSWSAVRAFRTVILPPEPVAPEEAADLPTNRPPFDWDTVAGATGYTLQVARDNQFKSLVWNNSVTPSSFNPGSDLPAHLTLYWRVQAKGPNGPSAWSVVRSLTTANPPSIPSLLAPATNTLVTTYPLTLDWSTSSLPAGVTFGHYRLELSTTSGFDAPLVREIDGIASSSITFASGDDFTSNTTYYWRVRAHNDAEEYSSWSAVRTFRTRLATPTLISPEEDAATEDRRPAFAWEAVGAGNYTLQVSRNDTFTSLVVNVTASTPGYIPTKDLPVGTLYWRVRANGVNGPSAWSAVRRLFEE